MTVGDDAEAVGGGLGADADAGEVLAQKVADERRLARGVLRFERIFWGKKVRLLKKACPGVGMK